MEFSRRSFLKAAGAVSVGFAGIKVAGSTSRAEAATVSATGNGPGYGELLTDPSKIFDLPEGFSYKVISTVGDEMSDGFLVPGKADGMATFPAPKGRVVVVRNHELMPDSIDIGPFGRNFERVSRLASDDIYDRAKGKPCIGGTTNITFNEETMQVEEERLSIVGTIRNCAGGPTPWNSWITCEETVMRRGDVLDETGQELEVDHGYNFEVPSWLGQRVARPIPLKGMGRFNHEAVAVDPHSGIVYQTEDTSDGLIYRYIPNQPGVLAAGGVLQALVIREQKSLVTRNWPDEPEIPVGKKFECEWITLDNVEAPDNDLRKRGHAAGAAMFARGEGMWYGNGEVYFACTNGGRARKGQIWRYVPSPYEGTSREADQPGTVELFVEPNDGSIVDNADNLCVAPWGDVIVCEDGSAPDQFLLGVTPKGEVYRIGRNAKSSSELAGVCFSPSGKTLFVNIQHDGLTLAITGPWRG